MPHEVALCVNRWLGDDADGTAVYILLKTPKALASACLIGSCSGEYMRTAVALSPASRPWM